MEINQDYFESTYGSRLISESELFNFVKGMPAILFRIETVKKRIEYLNDYQIDGLGEKSFLLLKNRQFSRDIIYEQDHHLYESFIHAIMETQAATTMIRIKVDNNDVRWLKLTGTPNVYNPEYYLGYISDVTSSIALIEEMNRKEDEQHTMLEMVDNPAFLVNMEDKKIISNNAAASDLFSYSYDQFRRLGLNDLLHPKTKGDMGAILEEVIFHKTWKGKILFNRKGNLPFLGKASFRSLKIKGRLLLRVSIHEFDSADTQDSSTRRKEIKPILSDSRKNYLISMQKKIAAISDITTILETLLKNPYKGQQYDGIIYSDIQIKKGVVITYSAGKAFKNLKFGESFAYEGTIAENIEQYKLNYLIIDNTLNSIKAIDWALFTPYGIRSYYAKPFYERNVLRTILILCSKEPNAFSEKNLRNYDLLNDPFIQGLKNWRKACRNSKKK